MVLGTSATVSLEKDVGGDGFVGDDVCDVGHGVDGESVGDVGDGVVGDGVGDVGG